MRLTRIKVAGFKSFVDPTELKLPGSLVGIVGPNGCGKSNTIDAVRWVMGESSAKHLRGESMDDVIFTGSGTRKPVSRASVELVFDNADGSLGGEYARYAEISIRREVSRDGASRYALNGTRCRRRDIRDVFLGTGLGPRSYAIIEQGMISRLIEAKPEDLRVFLEEAAGISKYKERRRETETRIRHTRDNLDRLDDLREEIDKQLEKLERQARTAERFQALKTDERRQRGQLLGLRRRDLSAERDEQKRVIGARETELEGVMVELRAAESAMELARLQRREAADRFGVEQQSFYEIGAEVARLEQSIEHARASRSERSRELADTERSLAEARRHLEDDSRRIAEIATAIETDQPAFERLDESRRASGETLAAAEAELAAWQGRRDAHRSAHADASRAAQVERSRIEQIERSLGAARQRAERLAAESGGLDAEPLAAALEEAITEELVAAEEEASLEASLADVGERRLALADSLKSESRALDEARAVLGQRLGRLASLEALQQASLEPEGSAGEAWLRERALADRPRLGSRLRVTAGWERAVEVVLAGRLEAVCVDDEATIARYLEALPEASLTLVDGAPGELSGGLPDDPSGSASRGRPDGGAEDASGELADGEPRSLADLAAGHPVLEDLLAGIRAVDSPAAALALRERLAPHESVVTRDGLWFGRRWLRVAHDREEDSVLLRGAEIERLREEVAAREADLVVRDARVEELSTTLREHEARRETAQHALNDAVRRLSEVRSGLRTDRAKLQQVRERRARLDRERDEVDELVERDAEELAEASDLRAEALGALETLEREGAALTDEEQGLRARQGALRAQVESDRGASQALAIRVESMKSAREATERNLARVQARIGELVTRRDQLDALFAEEDDDPIRALELALEDEVASRLASEATLGNARKALESVDERSREHEQARSRHDRRAQQVREVLQATLMRSEEARVRLATLDEQVAEHGHDPATLLDGVPEDATIPAWAEALEGIERRIAKLGPINLAAIDERAQTLERKEYLDHQHADVSEALETLERAIASIDRETKARFRETYEAVDAKFESFFPRLFGGGHARLELTGDDLLSTGVTVVAQPPGKSVKNIQLLSGGEKALTAVALVFAFFELNPSPFCMLDEVDAPLDDANVGRFCELVREMSERVQFIFITHNKVTMELADQLMGVTMTEPGVSRLVAVDVQAAAELAGA